MNPAATRLAAPGLAAPGPVAPGARSLTACSLTTVVVMAKAPVEGKVKTRLCPPCTPADAARLAEAALADTLAAVMATRRARPVLCLDGPVGRWLPPGIEVLPQAGGGLDQRLGSAVAAVSGPVVVVGMDTPQLEPATLDGAVEALRQPGTDAVLGPAEDGGWWCLGLQVPDRRVFVGVPMSTSHTATAQRRRLADLELRCRDLPTMRDVDTVDDARAVAALAPTTRFGRAFHQMAALQR